MFLASAAVVASAVVTAQQRDPEPRQGACFYEDVNYGGDRFCARTGERVEAMPPGFDDRVSSIRTFGRTEVTVYRDDAFSGAATRIHDDVPDLRRGDWNDQISSIQVRNTSAAYRGQARDGSYEGDSPNANRIVRRAYRDVLNRRPDPEELRRYRGRVMSEGWSEADIRNDLRSSGEYRERYPGDDRYGSDRYGNYSRERAEDIVRRAYRNVLNREPDPASAGYLEHVLNDGWTQQDVERDLRRSAEYRDRIR
jgi:hypothetical protein